MKKLFLLILLFCLSFDVSAQASGGQIKRRTDSKQQYNNSKKASGIVVNKSVEDKYKNMSMSILEKYATQGDLMAQFYLGYKYAQEGQYTTAFTWFQNPAARGLVRAQLWLAHCYYHGKGCDKDWTRAKLWLDAAANRGSEEAKEYLETWFK